MTFLWHNDMLVQHLFSDKEWSWKTKITDSLSCMSDICDSRIRCRNICEIYCSSSRCSPYAHRSDVFWSIFGGSEDIWYERNWFSPKFKILIHILVWNLMVKEPIKQQNHSHLVTFAQKFLVLWCRSSFYGNDLKMTSRKTDISRNRLYRRVFCFESFGETTTKAYF